MNFLKKELAFLSALMMTAISVPMSIASAEGFVKGDVDMDGVITGHDAAIVSQYADGILKLDLTEEQLGLADMNNDGTVDAADASLIAEKQVYGLCDMDGNDVVDIQDASDVLRMIALKKVDSNIDFGEKGIRADVDCNGVVDVYDAYCILAYYENYCTKFPCFEDGKYYTIITPEIEQEFIKNDVYVQIVCPEANIKTLQELYNLKWNISDFMDVDGDNKVTISDASTVLQIYAENAAGITDIYKASNDTTEKFDINNDGKIDINDATIILKAYSMNAAGLL